MKKFILAVVIGVLAVGGLSACTGQGLTDPSMQTLRYTGGTGQGSKFKECVDPGSKMVSDDTFYPYPTTQREDVWDTDNFEQGSKSADHDDLTLTDSDGNTVYVKMKVSFFLNTDCTPVEVNGRKFPGGTLQAFHELVGKTRHAYFNEDGSYGSGWLWAMDNYISSSVTDYMTKATRTEKAEDMWLKSSISNEFQAGLAQALPGLVNAGMETDLEFYKDFTIKIYSITPADDYLQLYKDRQAAQIKAQTANANKDAQIAEAKAAAAVAEQQAKVKQAEIDGYGSVDAYLKFLAIQEGINPFQPSYLGATQSK